MPLHPVPIIIGTTLAVIGSGYAFKKFIYDPHLAPIIDAFIAQHLPHSHQVPDQSTAPISVPAVSSGHSTATSASTNRHPHPHSHSHSHLRRRSHARRESIHELEESLLLHSKRSSHGHGPGSEHGHVLEESHGPIGSSRNNSIDSSYPLVQIEENHPRPETPQEAEIREIIFNYAPTPSRSGIDTPATLAASTAGSGLLQNPFLSPLDPRPHTHTEVEGGDGAIPSSTFSFLSLSQQSSPEDMHQTLDSLSLLSFAGAADQLHQHAPRTDVDHDNEDDEVLSLPETEMERMSEYQDAESYSPISRARTPAEGVQTQQTLLPGENRQVVGIAKDPLGDLGLSYVHQPHAQVPMATLRSAPAIASASGGGRGPMSVVSMSEEEEGWRSESDWEAVGSDAGR